MKHIIFFSMFVFSGVWQIDFDKKVAGATKGIESYAPCFKLYSTGTTANSDEIISIRLTKVSNGATELYSIMGQSGFVTEGAGAWCGIFNIAVTVSVGGTYSSVGIRNKSTGAVFYCQSNICCGDGQVININNVPLSTPYGTSWEVFLYNGSC